MKIFYLDCYSGVSGDMMLALLIDLGVPMDKLENELSKLPIGSFSLEPTRTTKSGIIGSDVYVHTQEEHAHRHLNDITSMVNDSELDPTIKEDIIEVFTKLATAEAAVHGTSLDKVHFHEVGAMDSIIDIFGTVVGLNMLEIDKIISSPLHLGTGFVECQHGSIPVPAPATLELVKNTPVYSTGIRNELTTPTGAALVTTLADEFSDIPDMTVSQVGYGAGKKELSHPNFLRGIMGKKKHLMN